MCTDDTFMGGGSRRVNVCILTTPLWGDVGGLTCVY